MLEDRPPVEAGGEVTHADHRLGILPFRHGYQPNR
jgi:hypothetical protein